LVIKEQVKLVKIDIGNKIFIVSIMLKFSIKNIGVPKTITPTPAKD